MTRSTLTRPLFAAAAFALLATAAVPSMASTARPANNSGAPAAMGTTGEAPRKICLSPTVTGAPVVTGSMLGKRVCHTKAEWEAKGVVFGAK